MPKIPGIPPLPRLVLLLRREHEEAGRVHDGPSGAGRYEAETGVRFLPGEEKGTNICEGSRPVHLPVLVPWRLGGLASPQRCKTYRGTGLAAYIGETDGHVRAKW